MANAQAGARQSDFHVLPGWFEVLQNTVFLSALILAEMFINGLMMTYGIVGNIEDPRAWGIFGAIGVVLMFAAGMLMGGMSVRCSAAAFLSWKDRDYGFALLNLLGLVIFATPEVWASLVERSTHVAVNAPDRLAMQLFGGTNWAVTPTVAFISLALPAAATFWGISSRKPPAKTAEEIAEEAQRATARIKAEQMKKVAKARANAEIRAEQLSGFAKTGRAALNAARGKEEFSPEGNDGAGGNGGDSDGGNDDGPGGGLSPERRREDGESGLANVSQLTPLHVRNSRSSLANNRDNRARSVARGSARGARGRAATITAPELKDALSISADLSREIVRSAGKNERVGGGNTTALVARVSDVRKHLLYRKPELIAALDAYTGGPQSASTSRQRVTPIRDEVFEGVRA